MRAPQTAPLPGGMREITVTTTSGQFLLRPSSDVNRAILGVIAKAQENDRGVRVHAWACVSTHYRMQQPPLHGVAAP